MIKASILLIEDDAIIGEGLKLGLTAREFSVDWVQTALVAWSALIQTSPDVVVLDLGLPDADGMQLLKRLRKTGSTVPVIILTARDAIKSRILGLDFGADDYLVKPITTDELAARIRAVARRNTGRASETLTHNDVSLDTLARQVYVGDERISLTPNEYELLYILLSKVGQAVSIDNLLSEIETNSPDASQQSVKVHIHSLRKKLNTDIIQTIRGFGYAIKS